MEKMIDLYDERYWNHENELNFPDRDALNESHFFVITYMEAPAPCNFLSHSLMNFSDFRKMMGYIKYVVLKPALVDILEIEDGEEIANYDEFVEQLRLQDLTDEQKEAVLLWYETEHIINAPAAAQQSWLRDFRSHFEYLFHHTTDCVYGLEIVFSDESLPKFWETFFMLDQEDEDEAEELEKVQKAIFDDNIDLLNEMLMIINRSPCPEQSKTGTRNIFLNNN